MEGSPGGSRPVGTRATGVRRRADPGPDPRGRPRALRVPRVARRPLARHGPRVHARVRPVRVGRRAPHLLLRVRGAHAPPRRGEAVGATPALNGPAPVPDAPAYEGQ